jgi:hypothetical protein
MALKTPINFVVPGTANVAQYPSGPYQPGAEPPVDGQEQSGVDLFHYLYNHPVPILNNAAGNLAKTQAEAESQFETFRGPDGRPGTLPKAQVVINPANGSKAPTPAYANDLAQVRTNYWENSVIVYQRAWAATHAGSNRPLIATSGLVLCMGLIIYDPARRVAALTHVDKDQKSELVAKIITDVFPGDNPLELYYIGGRLGADMEEATRTNLRSQLTGLYNFNAALPVSRLTIRSFDVIGRPHDGDVTFDTRSGRIFPTVMFAPPEVMGMPLDTLFRLWPKGVYIPDGDGSSMAEKAKQDFAKGDPDRVYLETIRCQWNGSSDQAWEAFKGKSNAAICRLTIEAATSEAKAVELNLEEELIRKLKAIDLPMMLEQSLKRWFVWSNLGSVRQAEISAINFKAEQAAKAKALASGDNPAEMAANKKINDRRLKDRAETTLTFAVAEMIRGFSKPTVDKVSAEFDKVLTKWLAKSEYAVAWEGRH